MAYNGATYGQYPQPGVVGPPPGQYPPPGAVAPPPGQYPQSGAPPPAATGACAWAAPARDGGWYPGYVKEKEQGRGRKIINTIIFIYLLILPIAIILCGIFVTRPGVVFQSYGPGNCSVRQLRFLEVKSCGCGKNCKSSYPCYILEGYFQDNVTKDSSEANMYTNYWDWNAGCSFKECNRDKEENVYGVKNEIVDFFKTHGFDYTTVNAIIDTSVVPSYADNTTVYTVPSNYTDISLNCFGNNEGSVFLEGLDSTLFIVCGCIPIMVLVIVLIALRVVGTPGLRFQVLHFFGFPYFCLVDRQNACRYACPPDYLDAPIACCRRYDHAQGCCG